MTLNHLKAGAQAIVEDLNNDDGMRRRLQDIGLTKGTRVQCVRRSPLGDPVAFEIRGAVIALRSEDSALVQVRQA